MCAQTKMVSFPTTGLDNTSTGQNKKTPNTIPYYTWRKSVIGPVDLRVCSILADKVVNRAKFAKVHEILRFFKAPKQWNSRSLTAVATGVLSSEQTVYRPASTPRARTWRTCLLQPIGSRRFDHVTQRSFPAGNRRPTWRRSRRSVGAASRAEVWNIPAEHRHPCLADPLSPA